MLSPTSAVSAISNDARRHFRIGRGAHGPSIRAVLGALKVS
jgi:hypothetical protein